MTAAAPLRTNLRFQPVLEDFDVYAFLAVTINNKAMNLGFAELSCPRIFSWGSELPMSACLSPLLMKMDIDPGDGCLVDSPELSDEAPDRDTALGIPESDEEKA